MYYDQFIDLDNCVQKEEFLNFNFKTLKNLGKTVAKKADNIDDAAKTGKTVAKKADDISDAAKTGKTVAKRSAGIAGTAAAVTSYTVKNPKKAAAIVGTAAAGTYVAADQGLLGDDAQQYADDLGEAAEDNAENVGKSLKKGMGKVTDAAENMLLKQINKLSNELFKCDIDTLFIIICICVFLLSLLMKKPLFVVLSLIFGGAVAINKYI